MDTRAGRDHLEVVHGQGRSEADAPTGGGPGDGPEEYGLRVVWQSEAVKIEAAEFLVATRVQEASRRRLARAMARLRDQLQFAERT